MALIIDIVYKIHLLVEVKYEYIILKIETLFKITPQDPPSPGSHKVRKSDVRDTSKTIIPTERLWHEDKIIGKKKRKILRFTT